MLLIQCATFNTFNGTRCANVKDKFNDVKTSFNKCMIIYLLEGDLVYRNSHHFSPAPEPHSLFYDPPAPHPHTEIFKFLASKVVNSNAPIPDGLIPLQIAVEVLSTK